METKISNKRLRELEIAERKLQALEAGGVDSWEWYGEAIEPFIKEMEREEKVASVLEDLEIALLNGAYEPSERGAGFAAKDESRAEALQILTDFLNNLTQ